MVEFVVVPVWAPIELRDWLPELPQPVQKSPIAKTVQNTDKKPYLDMVFLPKSLFLSLHNPACDRNILYF